MFALELGGQKYDWDSSFILSLFGAFAILIVTFIFIERKVEEPIISFEMFKQRLFGMSTIIALCYGAAFYVSNCVHTVIHSRCIIRWYRNKLRITTITDDVRISCNSAI